MADASKAWLTEQAALLRSLAGSKIVGWRGVEMAAREAAPGAPQRFDELPCLQLVYLQADLVEGDHWQLTTYQDRNFGLRIEAGCAPREVQWTGIYRSRDLTELPTGVLGEVSVQLEDDIIAEVKITIGQEQMLVLAGEVHENWDHSLRWCRLDESLLVFVEPRLADMMTWVPPRPGW